MLISEFNYGCSLNLPIRIYWDSWWQLLCIDIILYGTYLLLCTESIDHSIMTWVSTLRLSAARQSLLRRHFIVPWINALDVECLTVWCTTYNAILHTLIVGIGCICLLVLTLIFSPVFWLERAWFLMSFCPFAHPLDLHINMCLKMSLDLLL